MPITDTITAILTAPGRSALSVIRVSGQEAFESVQNIFESNSDIVQAESHTIHYGWIRDPRSKERIDEVLVMLMRTPRSYTGEDVVEIQCHGGYLPASKILELLMRQGVRLAEAGEFTRRAFLNGKVDLTRAEAIMDLVDAESDRALSLAASQKSGELEDKINHLRDDLIKLIAYIQADLDYPEDDIERLSLDDYKVEIQELQEDIQKLLIGARRGQLYREGLKVVIAGKPNVGKSSLLNALTGRNRAIVTDIPGTTRDVLREHISIDGLPIEILDTAGIRQTEDAVEAIGVELAYEALEEADLILHVREAGQEHDEETLENPKGVPVLTVLNKADKLDEEEKTAIDLPLLSARSGEGLEELSQEIFESLLGKDQTQERPLVSNRRHIALLEKVADHLQDFQEALSMGTSFDLLVIDLQIAWEELGLITGHSAEDDLLDEIFSRFCLGK